MKLFLKPPSWKSLQCLLLLLEHYLNQYVLTRDTEQTRSAYREIMYFDETQYDLAPYLPHWKPSVVFCVHPPLPQLLFRE